MHHAQLEADCSACFGLCCTAMRLDRRDGFGHDKPEGVPCHFLDPSYACRIHASREPLGYQGCIDFDCLGAGQRASRQFAGQNWQRDPAIATKLFARFAHLLTLQEMRQALIDAQALELDDDLEQERKITLERIAKIADENGDEKSHSAEGLLKTAQKLFGKIKNA